MKLNTLLLAAMLMVSVAGNAQTSVKVSGQIKGISDSCLVSLDDVEGYEKKRIASTRFTGEKFEFEAPVKSTPRLVNLCIFVKSGKRWSKNSEFQLMTDGSPITLNIDSDLLKHEMPYLQKQGFANKPDGRLTIEAGRLQRQMDEYLDCIRAATITADSASYAEAKVWFDNMGNEEVVKEYTQRTAAAKAVQEAKRNGFIAAHPDYAVTAALVSLYAYKPFSYSLDIFDRQYASLANNADTLHVNFIKRNLDYFRSHANGAPYTDFTAEDKTGKPVTLSSLMSPGKMTLIDFWASWCGPCRAAIPKVKAMAKEHSEKLQVVSCSVDEKKDKWLKAEREEAMPWMQLFLPMSKIEKASVAYSITSIPRLVLIDTDGRVLCITHSPDVVQQYLK